MTTLDFSPLYRTAIGFDHLANSLRNSARAESGGYPPYNIATRGEDAYRITMAVAGFSQNDIDITSEQNKLTISGKQEDSSNDGDIEFLYRGIANRAFERRFQLAEHVRVSGARLDNGLLHIDLVREVPEAMKPRQIQIDAGAEGSSTLVESKPSAVQAA